MTALSNRYDFVFLFDVTNGNPNGDPDAGNLPRLDPETNQGLVTDVCLKRKIRNYAEIAKGGDPATPSMSRKARSSTTSTARPISRPARRQEGCHGQEAQPAERRREASGLRQFMCDNFFDVRTFGAVMSTGINCGQVRGPVQISFARSVEPIVPLEISITRMAATNESGKGQARGRRRRRRAHGEPHHGPQAHRAIRPLPRAWLRFGQARRAHRASRPTIFRLSWDALRNMFEHDRSAARGEMAARKLIAFEHASRASATRRHMHLFERVASTARSDGDVYPLGDKRLDNLPPARRFSDYRVTIDREGLPEGVDDHHELL